MPRRTGPVLTIGTNRNLTGRIGTLAAMNNSEPRQMASIRELTREERAAIKKLVVSMCANYDRDFGCLPLDCDCVMLHKCWTGGGCKYFRDAVLPLDPILEAALTGGGVEMQPCVVCGTPFIMRTNKVYCSAACAEKAHRIQKRDSIRKKRGGL